MKLYFSLQFKMLNRHLTEFGIHPVLAYLLIVLVFCGLSFYLFSKTEYAVYIYPLLAFSMMAQFGDIDKNDFLKLQFSTSNYHQIRLLENSLFALPFCVFLMYKQAFLVAILLMIAAILLSFLNTKRPFSWYLPTPFYKFPYEFTVGFRNYLPFFLIAVFLLFMAIKVDNFNLGIFALVLVIITALTYYSQAETHFYVWIHAMTAKQFILHKMKIAIGYTLLLCLPFTLLLLLFFRENSYIILGIQLIGLLYPIISLLGKYSTYPAKLNLMQAFAIGLSFWFPPLLLFILPYLYSQAIKKLKPILEW